MLGSILVGVVAVIGIAVMIALGAWAIISTSTN